MKISALVIFIKSHPFEAIISLSMALLAIYICFAQLGASYFENWDEAWYAEVTRQMLLSRNFLVPHWNGNVFLDKPPLNFWLDSLFASILGLSELTIRLTSALSGLAAILIVTFYSWRKWGWLSGLLAYLTLALNNIFIWRTRTGNIDALAALLIVWIYFLIIGKNRYRYLLLGLAFGLLFLQKASVAYLPISIFILYEVLFNRKGWKKNLKNYLMSFGIFFLLGGGWALLAQILGGSHFFLYYFFGSSQGAGRISPADFKLDYFSYAYYSLQRRFFYLLVAGWTFLVLKIKKPENLTLLLFSTLLLIELTFTDSKNNWYLMYLIPFWSMTVAYGTSQIVFFLRKRLPEPLVVALIIIPSLYISYKTLTVNIASIIGSRASVAEVGTALKMKELARSPADNILRLDHNYPATIYYSGLKTYYLEKIEPFVYQQALERKTRFIAGKREMVDAFIKHNSLLNIGKRYEVGGESIVEIH